MRHSRLDTTPSYLLPLHYLNRDLRGLLVPGAINRVLESGETGLLSSWGDLPT